ncbi:hypothetical protein CYMTET_13793 [Cymbomonas tetramitiformis]|uniref:Uncharacterized protein n=1 Tax=Cymbomonas tetramitiformis TaxID=36881 RepID=A0AAE0GHD2_9CHLO|nr:hypothetical protein CYMTET_13793 [Cymbomonas tetramitiformis]
MQPEMFSGHSFRRGVATLAFVEHVPRGLVKHWGDWVSDAVDEYHGMTLEQRLAIPRLVSDSMAAAVDARWSERPAMVDEFAGSVRTAQTSGAHWHLIDLVVPSADIRHQVHTAHLIDLVVPSADIRHQVHTATSLIWWCPAQTSGAHGHLIDLVVCGADIRHQMHTDTSLIWWCPAQTSGATGTIQRLLRDLPIVVTAGPAGGICKAEEVPPTFHGVQVRTIDICGEYAEEEWTQEAVRAVDKLLDLTHLTGSTTILASQEDNSCHDSGVRSV